MNQKDKIELFFLFTYYRIYWNNKFIADTNVIYTFKHNLKLELHFNTNDEEQIYYSTIFFCAANLSNKIHSLYLYIIVLLILVKIIFIKF